MGLISYGQWGISIVTSLKAEETCPYLHLVNVEALKPVSSIICSVFLPT